MKRLFLLALAIAVVVVLVAKYFGLLAGPVVLHGQAISLLGL